MDRKQTDDKVTPIELKSLYSNNRRLNTTYLISYSHSSPSSLLFRRDLALWLLVVNTHYAAVSN